VLFLPGDNVLREGERGDNLYFLNKGELSVYVDRKLVKTLEDGNLFGEVALFTKLKRTATIDSDQFSNCAYLNQEDVAEIEENFPHLAVKFKVMINDYKDEKM
jgi:CRP-like cAMP-binding protein